MSRFKKLIVYRKAFKCSMTIFQLTKGFPPEERYALIDQIRRSSRAVCGNIAEGYRKRRYPNHFISKLTDADAECSETQAWLDFALACGYIDQKIHQKLSDEYIEIGKLLGSMMQKPERFQ